MAPSDHGAALDLRSLGIAAAAGVRSCCTSRHGFGSWRHAGTGRGIRPWQAAAYAAGWLSLAGALLSPLHWLGERLLHLAHGRARDPHGRLRAAAGSGAAGRRLRSGLSLPALRRPVWRAGRIRLRCAGPGMGSHSAAAGDDPAWRRHLGLACAGRCSMHRAAISASTDCSISASSSRPCSSGGHCSGAASPAPPLVHVFITMIHTSAPGRAADLRAARALRRADRPRSNWGLTPLEDQQLAGLVMWVPAGTIYAGAALAFVALWVRRSGRASEIGDAPRAS